MKFTLKGSIPALVTPFHDDFTVNFDKLGELIEFHIENASAAVLVLGTTGESPTIDEREQIEIVKYTVAKAAGRIHVMAGSGSNDTAKSIEMSQTFEKIGVDSLLLISPYYNRTNDSGMIKHFEAIADSVTTPVILYTVPARTGCNINPSVVQHLAKHPNIVGIKDATGDFSYSVKISRYVSDEFVLYTGNDDTVIPMLSLGASGMISVWANYAPKTVSNMVAAYLAGRHQEALAIQQENLDFINALFIETSPIPLRYMMNKVGFGVGPARLPLDELSDASKAIIDPLLERELLVTEE